MNSKDEAYVVVLQPFNTLSKGFIGLPKFKMR